MPLVSEARPSRLSSRLRRRTLRKLSAELARLETASRAARAERERLEAEAESSGEGAWSRTDQVLAAARRREDALRIAIGDCRAEIFKVLVRDPNWTGDERPWPAEPDA